MVNQGQASRSVIGVFIMIIILFFIFIFFSFAVVRSLKVEDKDAGPSLNLMNKEKSPIAVIELLGPIMDAKDTVELLLSAEQDESVKAIILRIDSPGGAVGPTQEIYEEMIRIDKIKPIYASFGSIAASGGYYIGAAARKIFASNGTLTGSIGVIMNFVDLSKLFEWGKVNPQVMKAGKYKDIGSPNRPMTAEEQQLLNTMLAQVHERFREDVLFRRKDKIQGDIIQIAQGQVFSGEEAVKIGLVDEIAGLWEAARRIHKELKFKGDFKKLRYLTKEKDFSWGELFKDLEDTKSFLGSAFPKYSMPMFKY